MSSNFPPRALAALLVVWPAVAAADDAADDAAPPRPLRAAVGVGGYGALTGPTSLGLEAVVELLPGGRAGRYGGRLDLRSLAADGVDDTIVTGGLTYEAGAARPLLAMFLHADAGAWSIGGRHGVALGAGLTTQLLPLGPLGVGLDTGATLLVDGTASELALTGGLHLRLAR